MKAQQTNLKKVHKGKQIPNILTISRLVIAVAIVLVLLIKPYGWDMDKVEGGYAFAGVAAYQIPVTKIGQEYLGIHTEFTYITYLSGQFLIAGGLFVIGCITAFLDGYLSRKYNWVSNFGKIMDPVADKVLIDATLIVLAVYNLVFVWIVIILVARDILVDATGMVKAKEGKVVPANIWGKCKTVFQMFGVMEILFVFNRIYFVATKFTPVIDSNDLVPFFQDKNTMEYMYNPVTAMANIGMYLALIFSLASGVIYEVQMLSKPKTK